MNRQSPEALLASGLAAFPFVVPESAKQRLLEWLDLLVKWNTAFNLTAIRDPADMVVKHFLDSLVIQPWIDGTNVLDVGSGAGLPGIPLAILNPDRHFTLLDSNGKKARFMLQSKTTLALANVTVVNVRIEDHARTTRHDLVVSRAFSSLQDFVRLATPALRPGGRLLAMKGLVPSDELSVPDVAALGPDVIPLQVPHLPDARHLVILRP
jgi:16S rRNA (guanine527-N7)-methyltransferase